MTAALVSRAALAMRSLASDLLAFALPQRCPVCGAGADPDRGLCDPCRAAVPKVGFSLCTRCLLRDEDAIACARHPGRRAWPAWVYDEAVACAVHAFKYAGRPNLAGSFADAIVHALPPGLDPDVVTEVPLHPARERERGYNQARALAEALADRIGAPHVRGALRRLRPTPAQAGQGAAARRRHLANAFAVPRASRLKGRRVLVVDDVLTTGATLDACLEALEAAGAFPVGASLAWAQ